MEETTLVLRGIKLRVFKLNKLLVGIPQDIGPRILYLSTIEKPDLNFFAVLPDISLETVDGIWRIFGGHRLWTAPEAIPRTYSIDDRPVRVVTEGNSVVVEGNPEYLNNVQKKLVVEPGEDDYSLRVTHVVSNIGRWPIEFSCWSLSVMREHGLAVMPLKPKKVDKHGLLPDRHVVFWPYTRLGDPRLKLLDTYIVIRHDPEVKGALKIGANANPPWVAYLVNGYVFIKKVRLEEHALYPDRGSVIEIYTNESFLELETLSPLRKIEPGGENVHVEEWIIRRLDHFEVSESFLDKAFSRLLEA